MARICIVTPGQLGSNPRVVKEANALAEAGHAVTVICTQVLAAVEPRDQAVMATAQFQVRRIAFGTGVGWRFDRLLQIIGQRAFALWPRLGFAEWAVSPMTRRLKKAALREAADLYIAHYPPALPAARHAAALRGVSFAFDAEDFHTGQSRNDSHDMLETRVTATIERSFLRHAKFVTAASSGIAEAIARSYCIDKPVVVLNTFPRAQAAAAPDQSLCPADSPKLYWFSQTIGPNRGLEVALEAIALSRRSPHIYLRGMVSPGYSSVIGALAARLGISDRVHLLDPIEPDLLERSGAEYDIGYVGEPGDTKNSQLALANKLFSYLGSGLAVLASDIPAHHAIAPDLGDAVKLFPACDAHALVARLDEWLTDHAALQTARRHAWKLGQTRFCWETDKAVLLHLVEASLGADPS